MPYRERMNIVNIQSGLFITSIYAWIVYQRYLDGRFDLAPDHRNWGKVFLIFIGVSIVAQIIIMTGFLLLAVGMPVFGSFIVFFVGGLISEIVDNSSQIYLYRKGV